MADDQRHGRIFGVLFIITFVTSIAALALFQPVLDDPVGYIAGGGKDNQIYLGAFLELLLIISNVGTAVVLYPIVRRQNELLAIGYVAARIIECVFIAAGIIFVLGVVSLRHDSPGAPTLAVSLAAAQGLDVPVRPRAHRPLRERADPRLPDVQVRPRPTAHGMARDDRRAAPPDRQLRRALRLVGPTGAVTSWSSRSSSGRRSSASTAPSGGSRTLRSFAAQRGAADRAATDCRRDALSR